MYNLPEDGRAPPKRVRAKKDFIFMYNKCAYVGFTLYVRVVNAALYVGLLKHIYQ